VFYGKVIGIKSLISFEGDSVKTITADFRNAVDEYLDFCAGKDQIPEKPFKGSFSDSRTEPAVGKDAGGAFQA
jgi:predicted HicB family RNase H-like nuclease